MRVLYIIAVIALTMLRPANCDGLDFAVNQITNFSPGAELSRPSNLVELNDELLLSTRSGLQKWDGSTLSMISDVSGRPVATFRDELYLASHSGALYRTDGESLTTVPGPMLSYYFSDEWFEFDDKLYFQAESNSSGVELYSTDGFSVSSVSDINPGETSSHPGMFTEFDGSLFFSANGPNGPSVFKVNGESIVELSGINPTNPTEHDSPPMIIAPFASSLYFAASGTLYRTNGESVSQVGELHDGQLTALNLPLYAEYRDELYFVSYGTGGFGQNSVLFKTDGNSATELSGYPSSWGIDNRRVVDGLVELSGNLVFPGESFGERNGIELLQTDGISIVELAEVNPGFDSSWPDNFTLFNGALFFTALTEDGRKLFITDGENTNTLASIVSGFDSIFGSFVPVPMIPFEDHLFFLTQGNEEDIAVLAMTDGHSVMKLQEDVNGQSLEIPLTRGGTPRSFEYEIVGSSLYFNATGPDGNELYALSVVPEPCFGRLLLPLLLIGAVYYRKHSVG